MNDFINRLNYFENRLYGSKNYLNDFENRVYTFELNVRFFRQFELFRKWFLPFRN